MAAWIYPFLFNHYFYTPRRLCPLKKHLPNLLTSLNLFCGCIASILVFRGKVEWVGYVVLLAAVFDLFDGFLARKLGVSGPFGRELDSLADMVTFGFVPGAILFQLLQASDLALAFPDPDLRRVIQFLPFVVTVFSGLRLAKFNIDTRQSTSFIGLPTPANTLWIISLPIILTWYPGQYEFLRSHWVILLLSILSAGLLVAELPLFSLKFKHFGWKGNEYPYILILIALPLALFFSFAALPMIVATVVLLSLVRNLIPRTAP